MCTLLYGTFIQDPVYQILSELFEVCRRYDKNMLAFFGTLCKWRARKNTIAYRVKAIQIKHFRTTVSVIQLVKFSHHILILVRHPSKQPHMWTIVYLLDVKPTVCCRLGPNSDNRLTAEEGRTPWTGDCWAAAVHQADSIPEWEGVDQLCWVHRP